MTSSLDDIRSHWANWARSFGTDLRATTRTSTIKTLEVDALVRAVAEIRKETKRSLSLLEAGCGNGYNCLRLARTFPDCRIAGFDYIPEMVEAARLLKADAELPDDRLMIFQDDVLQLTKVTGVFDVVLTVRCLINLNADQLQLDAISALTRRVAPAGRLLMIENNRNTYGRQNRAREMAGLPARVPAEFNHFFDESLVLPHLAELGFEVRTEDFGSLHDLVLYVLLPMLNGGQIDYDHPLVEAATKLSLAMNAEMTDAVGSFGQNRLYICRRRR